jgi:hypothetical protein
LTCAGVAAYVKKVRTDVPELQDLVAAAGATVEGEEGEDAAGR